MDELPLHSNISISGATILAGLYPKPITPQGLLEITLFNLNIVVNEFRLSYTDQFEKDEFDQFEIESYRVLMKELASYMPASAIVSFVNDRSKIYLDEYKKIRKDNNPVRWDAVYYLFYKNPLASIPRP